MRQVFQNISNGETTLVEVPCPKSQRDYVQIRTACSLISAGTERMLVDFGKSNIINKARQQPDKVRMVYDKVRTDGLMPTIEAVKSKLDQLLPLGYCNVGVVSEVGTGVQGIAVGDRVVSNGMHAEVVSVPKNLCVHIPENVPDDHAAFTVLGAIGLQGIRLANPTLGECVVVTGLGLIGLLTVQMLLAQGCRVLGIDFDSARLEMAEQFGAETVNLAIESDAVAAAARFSRGRGVDAVLITASSKSNEPVRQAARMCRKRGRIVLVGVAGLELSRADFYEKELNFQVSCSYGPGRYDPEYEERGHDYPIGHVRWTEQRNFEAVLDLMSSGMIDVGPLISHRYPIDKAKQAYELLSSESPALGIVLEYERGDTSGDSGADAAVVRLRAVSHEGAPPVVGVIGAGNYSSRVLIPAFKTAGADLRAVVSNGGISAVSVGKKFDFENAATDPDVVFADEDISVVVVATRHDSHAHYVLRAAESGKHVFVEKPLCLALDDLDAIRQSVETNQVALMVGFNRRFSPLVVKIKELISQASGPKAFIMTVNAGHIPRGQWVHDSAIGGGRVVGECCHFVDLLRHLSDCPIDDFSISVIDDKTSPAEASDNVAINLSFADGSIGTIHYLANGHTRYPKERLEVFTSGKVLCLENFRVLKGWGWSGFSGKKLWRQDKGQSACVAAFVDGVLNGTGSPIKLNEILEVSKVSIELGAMAT